MIDEFCSEQGSQYPVAFLGGKGPPWPEPPWNGTLITDQRTGYDVVFDTRIYPHHRSSLCSAHANRYFEELSLAGSSA